MTGIAISSPVFGLESADRMLPPFREEGWDGLWWHYRNGTDPAWRPAEALRLAGYHCGLAIGDRIGDIESAIGLARRWEVPAVYLGVGRQGEAESDDAYFRWITDQWVRIHRLATDHGVDIFLPLGRGSLIADAHQAGRLMESVPAGLSWNWVLLDPVRGLESNGQVRVGACRLATGETGRLDPASRMAWLDCLGAYRGERPQLILSAPWAMAAGSRATALDELRGLLIPLQGPSA